MGGTTWAVGSTNGSTPTAISQLGAGSYTIAVAGTFAWPANANMDFSTASTNYYNYNNSSGTINSLRFSASTAPSRSC